MGYKYNRLLAERHKLHKHRQRAVNPVQIPFSLTRHHFALAPFIECLHSLIRSLSPRVRVLALGWIMALDGEPDIHLLVFLHKFLYPLFALITSCGVEQVMAQRLLVLLKQHILFRVLLHRGLPLPLLSGGPCRAAC